MELHLMAVPQDWHQQASWCGHCNRNIDKVAFNDLVPINHRVDNRILLQSQSCSLQEERHKTKLDIVFFQEVFPQFLSHLASYLSGFGGLGHIDLLEGREESIGILGFFQPLTHLLSQTRHIFSSLYSLSTCHR